jgi:serine/threonine-protein kinase 24/25/MST4
MPGGMIPDEDAYADADADVNAEDDDDATAAAHAVDSSVAAVKGSDVTARPHSRAEPVPEPADDAPPADADAGEPATGAPPPAYDAAAGRGKRRSSYGQRSSHDGRGTSLRAADIGSGVDTIRPVKKVDKEGSLRLSSDFVGSLRARPDGAPSPGGAEPPASPRGSLPRGAQSPRGSLTKSPPPLVRSRSASEAGKAGTAMVHEIIVPLLRKVWRTCYLALLACSRPTRSQYGTTWTRARSSR